MHVCAKPTAFPFNNTRGSYANTVKRFYAKKDAVFVHEKLSFIIQPTQITGNGIATLWLCIFYILKHKKTLVDF